MRARRRVVGACALGGPRAFLVGASLVLVVPSASRLDLVDAIERQFGPQRRDLALELLKTALWFSRLQPS
jgi:hypothetical protein